MQGEIVPKDSVRAELGRILASSLFEGADRARTLLTFVVEESINGRAERLKEYTIGSEAFSRGDGFDPRTDPIVRAEASRLRSRLDRYYAMEGQPSPIAIMLPKGSYVPQFMERSVRESAGPKSAVVIGPAAYRSPRLLWLAGGALTVVCAFLLGRLVPQRSVHPEKASILQFDVEMNSKGVLGGEVGTSVVLSPDGTRVVFISIGPEGVARLNTRRLDQSQVVEMPGTDGARGPFFSPDGRWVGFWSSGKLKKTAVDGGSPVALCDGIDTWRHVGSRRPDYRCVGRTHTVAHLRLRGTAKSNSGFDERVSHSSMAADLATREIPPSDCHRLPGTQPRKH